MTPNSTPFSGTVAITGATGFVGRYLTFRLAQQGVDIIVLSQSPTNARALLGEHAVRYVDLQDDDAVAQALEDADALVNLAGETLFARWTSAYKKRLRASRVDLSSRLAKLCTHCTIPPQCVVSVSAVGYYGVGSALCDEQTPAGKDFLARLARDWEEAWNPARAAGIRVVHPRLGVILGVQEGMLGKLSPALAHGISPVLGSGEQYVSWVHIQDVVRMLEWALGDNAVVGPYNVCAPHPVPYNELVAALAQATKPQRDFKLPLPAFLLRTAMGEMSMMMTKGQRVQPKRALTESYAFAYPKIARAAAQLLDPGSFEVQAIVPDAAPACAYHEERKPDRRLTHTMVVDAPIDEVFAFFSRPVNLLALTPSGMELRCPDRIPDRVEPGLRFKLKLKFGAVPMSWTVEVLSVRAPHAFVDVQHNGPYACWHHEHRFVALGPNKTQVTDTVHYRVGLAHPLAGHVFGLLEQRLVRPELERMFAARRALTRMRFTPGRPSQPDLRATLADIAHATIPEV